MFAILGIVLVFGSVIGGFLMEHGKLPVLAQPAELIIIGGSALGTLLAANPLPLIIKIFKSLAGIIGGSRFSAAFYLESLKMLSDIFQFARKSGMAKLEEDIENPGKSAVFSKYPKLVNDHHVLYFICDTLRTAVSGVVAPHDLDTLVETDIDIHHHASTAPVRALSTVADALPGLGIVAAVLGIVITMGALGGPPRADRREGGRRLGRDLPRDFALLRTRFAARLEPRKDDRGRVAVLSDAPRRVDGLCQRDGADDFR
jgi:chemotaxis protein MotA